MFCNFCGKNFDPSEGFEEVSKSGHHFVRCEKCAYEQKEEEYDWRNEMYGRHLRWPNRGPQQASSGQTRGRSRSAS